MSATFEAVLDQMKKHGHEMGEIRKTLAEVTAKQDSRANQIVKTIIGSGGHEYPGRGICPCCGRNVAYRRDSGINYHLPPRG